MMLATATWTAYNDWGGANHYFGTWGKNGNESAPILSLKRPWTRGMLWLPKGAARIPVRDIPDMGDAPHYPSKEWGYSGGWGQFYAAAGWAQYDRHFALWAEAEGYEVDYITQTDLHYRPDILDGYSVVTSCGHDEYWSATQRANMEAARDAGVNLAFFTGNTGFWKTRWEPSADGSSTTAQITAPRAALTRSQAADPVAGRTFRPGE
jgi:hypothetical protein